MKQSISFYDFERAFVDMGRADSFTYEGKRALFDWLEELEEGTGEEMELDVIALDCEFCEYDSALDCVQDCGYDADLSDCEDDDDKQDTCLEYLRDKTLVIEFDGGIIIQGF